MEEVRTCKLCCAEKELTLFVKYKQGKNGYRVVCKSCQNAYKKKRMDSKREHYREYLKSYRQKFGRKEDRDLLSRLKSLLVGARNRRSFDFSIDLEHLLLLWKNQNGLCAYSKLPLTIEANQQNIVSLDRIDSSKGYVVGNVQLVCRAINEMKMDRTENMFIYLCSLVSQNNIVKGDLIDLAVNRQRI